MDDATRAETLIEVIAPAIRGATYDGQAGRVVRFVEPGGETGSPATGRTQSDTAAARTLQVDVDAAATEAEIISSVATSLSEYRRSHGDVPARVAVAGTGEFEIAPLAQPVGTAMPSSVANKVCVVTGGARGFGEQIARSLAADAAAVFLVDLDEAGASALAVELNETHGREVAFPLAANVADEASVAALVGTVIRRAGGIDLFVSNAGVLRAGSVKELSYDDFRLVTNVNYDAFFLCTKHAAPVMARQFAAARTAAARGAAARETAADAEAAAPSTANRSSDAEAAVAEDGAADSGPAGDNAYQSDIIQINSKSGLVGSNRNAAYAGSKFGGIGLVQSFALELIEDGIKVNAICPGNFFDGPLWSDPQNGLFVQYLRAGKVPGAETVADVKRAYEAKVPMGRGCRGVDVMRALRYVVGQRYETGQAVPVTGGQEMLR